MFVGHNKLWRTRAINSLSVIMKIVYFSYGQNWPLPIYHGYGHCELLNVVAFGYNELWRPRAVNSLSFT